MPELTDILRTMDYGPAPEANDQVLRWLDAQGRRFGHFIGGGFTAPGAAAITVHAPATGEPLAQVALGAADAVDAAVQAARAAAPGWAALPGAARARYLYALARLLQKRERFFAVLESMDNGKPIRESRDIDIPLAVRHFYHHAGWAELLATEFPGQAPVGVCAQIIPWNFPLLMLAWKVAPALAAGNTVVLKPAEDTPLPALAFATLCQEAGLPAGVFTLVTGNGGTGAALAAHPGVDKVAFTGSTEVGRAIRAATAGSGKKLSLELGGKSPFIVFEDADLDSAVEGVVDAIWFNQGQVCCAGSRLLVQQSVAERFHARLKTRAARLRVGDPLDKSVDIGAIVSAVQLQRIARLVEQGRAEAAECWQPEAALPARGWYFAPTLFTGVAPSATIAQEEIFGPVLVSSTFRTQSEAVALANHTRYGLAASVWSENLNIALDVAAQVQAGVVWINATNLFDAASGFGGYRESGFGREGGREGMVEYLREPVAATRKRPATPKLPAPDFSAAPWGALAQAAPVAPGVPALDRTAKLYIAGKQVRPDAGQSYTVSTASGKPLGQAGLGNRKDVRNAVEAAHAARGWAAQGAHQRAQVLYYLAEHLEHRAGDFARRLQALYGGARARAEEEVRLSVARVLHYAAHADKFDGAVHPTRQRHVTLAMPEPWGVVGIVCPGEAPLLALVSLLLPAIAMGNRAVLVPAAAGALVATDLVEVLETSDVPAGVVNLVTGEPETLARTLAEHDDVAALWYGASVPGAAAVERAAAGNLKSTWTFAPGDIDWSSPAAQGRAFLRRATQIKNIWVPYGD